MDIIEINPQLCKRWQFADRSNFEFGDTLKLGTDIKNNGQVEPVIVRKSNDSKFKYEVIAGSRRHRACLETDILMKAIVKNISDQEAFFMQLRENEKQPISDYSRGMNFKKLIDSGKSTVEELSKINQCSKEKIYHLLSFASVPTQIWDAVANMSKVSCRSASTINALAKKGDQYVSALIDIAEEIRKGAGSRKIENLVNTIVNGEQKIDDQRQIVSKEGNVIGKWVKNTIVFDKSFTVNQKDIEDLLTEYL
ncbi:ParB/RepB/Spo0J family partition protein [Thiotrichales bacterium 19S3-7]|nr:ParB/RepB/Spo0J family partition protein [Thiotrichales bacterium 19S3-7]MCF6802265.1 ParB/RepB/Spo0J family partition protein [Thiotrichales bacterium 19S3-11]